MSPKFTPKAKAKTTSRPALKPDADGVVRLAGGNPQIPLGYGDEPVQAYIAAMPGWKQAVGRTLDTLITKAVPGVRKAVKWNTPFYGAPDQPENHYFLGFHCLTKYVKVAFLNGKLLDPLPPGFSKTPNARYLDIYEDKPFDEKLFVAWVKQAAKNVGEKL